MNKLMKSCTVIKEVEKLSTECFSINGALPEDHDVLGEGACFVWENELHLAQLLVQGGGPSLRRSVRLTVVHLTVPVNEVTVAKPQHLHAGGKGPWLNNCDITAKRW